MIFPDESQTMQGIAHHYDSLSDFYLDIWGEHVHHGLWLDGKETADEAVLRLITVVADEARIGAGTRVCDIGCGYGGTARELVNRYGANVTAFTISPAQYDFARKRAGTRDNPEYLLQDWLANQLSAGSQDAVLSIESSEHMQDKPAFFREVARVLSGGGRAVICAWLSAEHPRPWQVRHLLEPICREGRLPSMGSESDYRRLFEDAGMTVESFQDVSAKVKKTWPVCIGRFIKGLATRPSYRRFVLHGGNQDRVFAKTLLRLWAAYETKSMRYGIFTAVKA
jgi:cyclopropane fatty-acyl-phospholipid synthase-like methyltransferase